RGYFATAYSKQFMKREDRTPTNGVFQFLKYFIDGIQTFQPSHVICCWDMGKQTFRTSLYDNYNANRADPTEDLIPQFDLAKQSMKREDGCPTDGVFQFLKYFIDGIQTFQPSYVICCWDMGKQTFRTSLYDNYKANRADPPEELIPQFDLAKEAVDAFSIPNIGLENYEADDDIGSLAHRYKEEYQVVIQSRDQDLLQLVDQNIQVAIMRKGIGNYEVFHEENFFEKRGLHPHQIIEFKAFTGDSADNYPGIKGIGEKTALKLLQTYG